MYTQSYICPLNLWSTEKRFHPKIVCFETTKTTFQNFEFVYFLRLSLTVIDFPSVWCAQHLSLCFANQFDANRCSFENSVDSVKHVQTFLTDRQLDFNNIQTTKKHRKSNTSHGIYNVMLN